MTPLKTAAGFAESLGKGEVPGRITHDCKGDLKTLKNNLNDGIDAMGGLIEANKIVNLMAVNDHTTDVTGIYPGIFGKLAEGVNTTLKRLRSAVRISKNMAAGDYADDLAELKKIGSRSENDSLMPSFIQMMEAVDGMAKDVEGLVTAILGNNFKLRADAQKHSGEYRKIVEGINQSLDMMFGKLFWYGEILDTIPFPVSVTDLNKTWTFVNKAAFELAGKRRSELVGKPCSTLGLSDCNTEKCGITGLCNHQSRREFEHGGKQYQADVCYLLGPKGDKIGHVELLQDVTAAKTYTSGEVSRVAQNLDKLAQGNFDLDLQVKETDSANAEAQQQFARIYRSLSAVKSAINAMTGDVQGLCQSAIEGKLSTRADASQHQGEYKEIVDGFNATLDAVTRPLSVSASYIERISKGDIPEKITDTYNGDFGAIKDNLNQCIDALNGLLTAREEVSRQHELGMIDAVMPAEKFQGAYATMAKGINDLLQSHIDLSVHMVEVISRYAAGDLSADMDRLPGMKAMITEAMDKAKASLMMLECEIMGLVEVAKAGMLSMRADSSKFDYNFKGMIDGLNAILDAVTGPITVAAECVDRIGKGDIPAKITDEFNGDFDTLRNNLNACIDGLGALVETNAVLQRMALNDHSLPVSGSYQGIFADVANATNTAQSRVKSIVRISQSVAAGNYHEDLAALKKIGKRSENDEVLPNFIQMMEAIDALNQDAGILAKAAVDGKLSVRADVSKHQGEYRKVIEGINRSLDAFANPLQDVAGILDRLAGGDLTAEITKQHAGDFKKLADAVNTLAVQVRSAIQQIGNNTKALVAAAEELNKVSQQMGASAEETSAQVNVVSGTSVQVSNNVSTVASAAEEMGASIKEIAKSTAEATRVATSAVKTAEATNKTISKLGQSSAEIGQVIKVITSIAQQTNLLALNATIEAARAGEAGKGFAVVANEVKELAKETAKATEDISRKIEAIQTDTKGAVEAIGQIGSVIVQISDIQNTIASAVEEQSATTNEISRNLSEAANGSNDINRNITGVADAARSTAAGALNTQKSAQALERMAAELQGMVAQFKY